MLALLNNAKLRDSEWIVFGNLSAEALAEAMAENPYSQKLFTSGVLIVPQVYMKRTPPGGYVQSVSVEGIGSTPEQAAYNLMIGVNEDEVASVSHEVEEFFSSRINDVEWEALERKPEFDTGIFMKREGNGGWKVVEKVPMDKLRRETQARYVSNGYIVNKPYKDLTMMALQHQEYYEKLGGQLSTQMRERNIKEQYERSLRLRREAIAAFDESRTRYEQADKYARIASGISFLASIAGLAGTVAGNAARRQVASEAAERARAAEAAMQYKAEALRHTLDEVNRRNTELYNLLRGFANSLPLPDSEYSIPRDSLP